MSRVNYLFLGLDDKTGHVSRRAASSDQETNDRIAQSGSSYIAESDKDAFKARTIFGSFHYQVWTPISNKALLAGFFMLWLKKCVVTTLPYEVVSIDVMYPAVMLIHDIPLGLLPIMVSCH